MSEPKSPLTHLDAKGRARMVDVGAKPITERICVAAGEVRMEPATLRRIVDGTTPKGDVLATARIAGIQASKRTDEWIPLAHPLPLEAIEVAFSPDADAGCLGIEARVQAHARTGVEMEALVAVAAAGLTIYDMCKAIDRSMTISAVRLLEKQGGKSGCWRRDSGPGPDGRAGSE